VAAGLVVAVALVIGGVFFLHYIYLLRATEERMRDRARAVADQMAETLVVPAAATSGGVIATQEDIADGGAAASLVAFERTARAYLSAGNLIELCLRRDSPKTSAASRRCFTREDALPDARTERGPAGKPDSLVSLPAFFSRFDFFRVDEFVLERELPENVLLSVRFHQDEINDLRRAILSSATVLTIVVLSTIVVTTRLLLGKFLRRPLWGLEEGLRVLSRGDYGYRMQPAAQSDVNRIVESVNDMARQIQLREQDLRDSERKYKHLVEDSNDIIFSLSRDGMILTMNRAIRRHLGFMPARVIGRSFAALLYGDPPDLISQRAFWQSFEDVKQTGGRAEFRTQLTTAQNEPKELNVQLEYVHAEGGVFVYGKAQALTTDILAQYCRSEVRRYLLGNYLSIAEMLVHTMTSNLSRYCDRVTAGEIRIGAKEMLYNAIEHGNLNISYDEKTRATARSDGEAYFKLIVERQQDPRYRDRRISVAYSLTSRRVMFVIRDEGAGFDHRSMQTLRADGATYHGRGIVMTREIFDQVRYNEAGNAVVLVKYFESAGPSTQTMSTRTGMPSSTALPEGTS
jgi:PAS domain S-box-containing protein